VKVPANVEMGKTISATYRRASFSPFSTHCLTVEYPEERVAAERRAASQSTHMTLVFVDI
jgi:hypothetical protein